MARNPPPPRPPSPTPLGSADAPSDYRVLVTLVNAAAAMMCLESKSPRYLDRRKIAAAPRGAPPDDCLELTPRGSSLRERGLAPLWPPKRDWKVKESSSCCALTGTRFWSDRVPRHAGKDRARAHVYSLVERDGGSRDNKLQASCAAARWKLSGPSARSAVISVDARERRRHEDCEGQTGIGRTRHALCQLASAAAKHRNEISFQYDATEFGLQIVKKFRLAKVDPAEIENPSVPAYHLEFAIEVRNVGEAARKVAWRLEGPTGLPLEGAWYATKMSPNWRGEAVA